MEELLSCRKEVWDFGGCGQRSVARKGLNIGSRPVGVVCKDLEMDRLEDIGGIRDPRELKGKNWLWLRPRRLLSSL